MSALWNGLPGGSGAEIDCLMCGQPLQTGDGDSFFKYFLVDPSWLSREQLLALHHDTLHHDELQVGRQ